MNKLTPSLVGGVLLILLLSWCSRSNKANDFNAEMANFAAETDGPLSPILPRTAEGWPFDVPSDVKADYRLLFIKKRKNGHLEVMTRRDSPSGTSFERYEVSCLSQTMRPLGDGDTREQALKDEPSPGKLTDLVPKSIEFYTLFFACRKSLE